MSREDAKKILGEGATDEQITALLNSYHAMEKVKNDEIANLKAENSRYSDYESIKSQLEEINKAKLTEQEKMEIAKKEIEQNLKDSRITKNKSKVMTILAGCDIDEEIIDSLVGEDETLSINKANKLKAKLQDLEEAVAKKTKESLTKLDLTPDINNAAKNDNDVMTWDKFRNLSQEEQNKFQSEHPEEFNNL